MIRITREQLDAFVEHHRPSVGDVVDLATVVTENVLAEYLGAEWVYRYIRGPEGAYFRATSNEPAVGFLHYDRMISLAELLLNLQDTPGINGVLQRLCNGEIEAAIAELEAGHFLAFCSLPFRFRTPQSARGADYDLEIDLVGHQNLPCEGKCKLEGTPLTYGTVKQTLETARKQLPKKNASVIILKLPGAQMTHCSVRVEIGRAVADLFHRSGRVSGIIVWWEIWEQHPAGSRTKRVKYRNDANPNARTPVPMEAFEPVARNPDWIDLLKLVGAGGGCGPV
jgi:hypothetical protein